MNIKKEKKKFLIKKQSQRWVKKCRSSLGKFQQNQRP